MVRDRLLVLAERRALLVQRAQAERTRLEAVVERADGVHSLLAGVRNLFDELRCRPLLLAAAVALFFVLRPRRALKWLTRGWSLWRPYRGTQRWWSRVAAAAGPAPGRTV